MRALSCRSSPPAHPNAAELQVKVACADLAAFRCTCLIAAAPAKAPVEKGRKQSIAAIRKKVPFVPAEGSDRVGSEDE